VLSVTARRSKIEFIRTDFETLPPYALTDLVISKKKVVAQNGFFMKYLRELWWQRSPNRLRKREFLPTALKGGYRLHQDPQYDWCVQETLPRGKTRDVLKPPCDTAL
jgi:hypothetical protein